MKTSLAAQRTGGHRRVASRKTTGGYPATQGTDPETELNGQWCCAMATSSLHRSWYAVVFARSGNRLHSVHPCAISTRHGWRLLVSCLSASTETKTKRGCHVPDGASVQNCGAMSRCVRVGHRRRLFCGLGWRGARRLQKLFFALAGCRRHCAIMNIWLLEASRLSDDQGDRQFVVVVAVQDFACTTGPEGRERCRGSSDLHSANLPLPLRVTRRLQRCFLPLRAVQVTAPPRS